MQNVIRLLILALLVNSLIQCSSDDSKDIAVETIIGRWIFVDFEDQIRYEFTSDKLYTIYSDGKGVFPTLEEFQQQNPNITGLDWYFEGDTLVVDLNFGNFSRQVPNFKCDNNVIDWSQDESSFQSTYYREGHDILQCN